MSDKGMAQPRLRAWTRVLAATLITLQVIAAAFFAFFIVAAAGCDIAFGSGSCDMTGIKIFGSLAVLGISGGMLAWWIYAFARVQRAGLVAALVVQAFAVVAGVVATIAAGDMRPGSLAVAALVPGVITLVIMVMDGGLRRRILTSATS